MPSPVVVGPLASKYSGSMRWMTGSVCVLVLSVAVVGCRGGEAKSASGQGANAGAPGAAGSPSVMNPRGSGAAADGTPVGSLKSPRKPPSLAKLLVFTRTLGYRHESIGAGVAALRALGASNAFEVLQTEDPAQFSDDGLSSFDVVVFLSTTADVLDEGQQGALQRFIRTGHGWVGIHAASDTEYGWPWYGELLGGKAWFKSHPKGTPLAMLDVEKADHVSTAHLPARFGWTDEWYNFRANPRAAVTVLLRVDETSYAPGPDAMGGDHPIAWYHEFDGGRAFYTGLGHSADLYSDNRFTQHLLGGIRWAAGVAP
jgi:type 1 glutamine amidotransferase